MAEDVIALLDFVGWTEKRSLHLVALSLGGMIAQELTCRIPERFISLTLGGTTAGGLPWSNIPPWPGLRNIIRAQCIKDPKNRIPCLVEVSFSAPWLGATAENDAEGRTNREVQIEQYQRRAALTHVQNPIGAISQMWAALTHRVQPSRLAHISKTIPKVVILTGEQDLLVSSSNSAYLKKHMPEAEYIVWKDSGHVVNSQYVGRYNSLLERVFLEGQARLDLGKSS